MKAAPTARLAEDAPAWRMRRARDGDAQDLFGLLALCFADYPGCYVDPHDDLAELLRAGRAYPAPGAFWVVEDAGGRVCACLALDWPAPHAAELHRLYVRPDMRRAGLGERLVRLAEAHAAEHGAAAILFWSDSRFLEAHRLYARLGYVADGASRELGDVSRSVELRFGKALTPHRG